MYRSIFIIGSLIFFSFYCLGNNANRQLVKANKLSFYNDSLLNILNSKIEASIKLLNKDKSKTLNFYFSESDLVNYYDKFTNKWRSIYINVGGKQFRSDFINAPESCVLELIKNFEKISKIFLEANINNDELNKIDQLIKANQNLFQAYIFLNPTLNNPQLDNCVFFKVKFTVFTNDEKDLDNYRVHVLSKLQCRELVCADCLKAIKKDCSTEFMDKIKSATTFSSINQNVIMLSPGPYILIITQNDKIIYTDITPIEQLPCDTIFNLKIQMKK